MIKTALKAREIIVFLAMILMLVASTEDAIAAKSKKSRRGKKARITRVAKNKRSYNPSKTKSEALEILRNVAGLSIDEARTSQEVGANFIDRQYSNMYETDRNLNAEDTEGEDLDELYEEDDIVVNIDQLRSMWMSYLFADDPSSYEVLACGISKQEIMNNIMDWLGTPYLFGGTTRSAIDCSAFVRTIFQLSGNIILPRTAAEQNTVGAKVKKNDLQFGDLVFFNTRKAVYVSHVGIYLGDNLFAHASSRYGVTVSSLESAYYSKRFIGSKRLTSKDIQKWSMN